MCVTNFSHLFQYDYTFLLHIRRRVRAPPWFGPSNGEINIFYLDRTDRAAATAAYLYVPHWYEYEKVRVGDKAIRGDFENSGPFSNEVHKKMHSERETHIYHSYANRMKCSRHTHTHTHFSCLLQNMILKSANLSLGWWTDWLAGYRTPVHRFARAGV